MECGCNGFHACMTVGKLKHGHHRGAEPHHQRQTGNAGQKRGAGYASVLQPGEARRDDLEHELDADLSTQGARLQKLKSLTGGRSTE